MPTQDASHIREKILSILRIKGPTLPVHIAQETGMSMLFSSAFLSELLSDKKIKMSHMRVGNSPIYFVPGQEPQLERFSNYLKSKERDAFILLQEKKFLKDSEQNPAIRVALREIRDFAIHFKNNGEIIWRYFTIPESEFKQDIKPIEEHKYIEAKPKVFDKEERKLGEKIIKDIKIEDIEEIRKDNEKLERKEEEIKEKEEPKQIELEKEEGEKIDEVKEESSKHEKNKIIKEKDKKPSSKAKSQKAPKKESKKKTQANENFFNKIKEYLSKKDIEILDIVDFSKDEAMLKTRKDNSEEILFAFNKKKISEKEILKASKKSSESGLNYSILCLGETPKKISDMVTAMKKLSNISKIED
jgi:hypothetical protein